MRTICRYCSAHGDRYIEAFKDLFTLEEQKQLFAVARKGEEWYALKINGDVEKLILGGK